MVVRKYTEYDLHEIIRIWNEVVEDGWVSDERWAL